MLEAQSGTASRHQFVMRDTIAVDTPQDLIKRVSHIHDKDLGMLQVAGYV